MISDDNFRLVQMVRNFTKKCLLLKEKNLFVYIIKIEVL